MPGIGTYRVGVGEPYDTLQDAIDALVADQGAATFTSTQRILITDSRTYSGCSIAGLSPLSTRRLVIEADDGASPVLSGQANRSSAWTGILVEGVPYLTVQGLVVRDFSRGLVATDCDELRVLNCIFRENDLVGVFLSECEKPLLYGNALSDSHTLISLSRCYQPVLVHNSGANFRNGRYALYLDPLRVRSGAALQATDNLHYLINNVFHCAGEPPIVLTKGYERAFSGSNGNVYYSASGAVAEVREDIDRQVSVALISGIVDWRMVSGGDDDSRFADAVFLRDSVSKAPVPSLQLDLFSPIGLAGVEILDDPGGLLPEWVDASLFGTDSEGKQRRVPPTPGVFELDPSNNYGFTTFFGGGVEDTSETAVDGVDRVVRQLSASLECWNPKIHRGFFFVRDSSYYLFAEKRALSLREVTWTEFQLPAALYDVSVRFGSADAEFVIADRTIWVSHAAATVEDEVEGDIRVHGTSRAWNEDTDSFDEVTQAYEFLPRQGRQVYLLPTAPRDGAPIVVTDDKVGRNDDRSIVPYQFSTRYNEDLALTELLFEGRQNRFENADFCYLDEADAPLGWEVDAGGLYDVVGETSVVESGQVVRPLVGDHLLHASAASSDTSAYLTQEVFLFEDRDVVLSFYLNSLSHGALRLSVESLDENRSVLGRTDVDFTPTQDTSEPTWDRYVCFCPASDESEFDTHGATYQVRLADAPIHFSDGRLPTSLRVSIAPRAAGDTYLDAVMATEGSVLPRFSRMPWGDGMTVEYEASEGRLHELDLTLTPVLNPQHSGFLTIGPIRADRFDRAAPTDGTTLSDWRWPTGRLTYLPWARLDGPNKLQRIAVPDVFGYRQDFALREGDFDLDLPSPKTVRVTPSEVILAQGGSTQIYVSVLDQHANPYAYEAVRLVIEDEEGEFPGYIGVREMGVASQLGQDVSVTSDPSGTVVATVLAPDRDLIRYVGSPPDDDWISLPYEVARPNHGNLRVEDAATGAVFDLEGTETSQAGTFVTDGQYAKLTLSKYPVFGSVSVAVDLTSEYDLGLEETVSSLLPRNFFVDYRNREVWVPSELAGDGQVTYKPRLAWLVPDHPRRVYFGEPLLSDLTSDLIVDYDAVVTLTASVDIPGDTSEVADEVLVVFRRP